MKVFLVCLDFTTFIVLFISLSECQTSNVKTLPACVQLPQIFWEFIIKDV